MRERDSTKLMEHRKKIKSKKPVFIRQDAHKKKKLAKRWKRPRGLHSKIRLVKKGYSRKVKKGWKSPKAVRGFTVDGLIPIKISTLKELEKLTAQNVIILASKIGDKKRRIILQEIKRLNIKIMNVRDLNKAIEKIDERLKEKKEKKKIVEGKKKAVEKESKKSGLDENKEKKIDEKVDEIVDKKKKEKKELDKLITKRI